MSGSTMTNPTVANMAAIRKTGKMLSVQAYPVRLLSEGLRGSVGDRETEDHSVDNQRNRGTAYFRFQSRVPHWVFSAAALSELHQR